jgi:hypothetical protein
MQKHGLLRMGYCITKTTRTRLSVRAIHKSLQFFHGPNCTVPRYYIFFTKLKRRTPYMETPTIRPDVCDPI